MFRRSRRTERGKQRSRRTIGPRGARVRLWVAVLALALVPALSGVLLASALAGEPDPSSASDRARLTSAAAASLLVHGQRIESRVATVAADPALTRLLDGIGGSDRYLARRVVSALREAHDPVVVSVCVTRARDGRTTLLADQEGTVGIDGSCATGALLDRALAAAPGTIVRAQPSGSGRLLLASPLGDADDAGDAEGVLAVGVDLEALMAATDEVSRVAPAALMVDTGASRSVAGTTRSPDDGVAGPPTPQQLSVYVRGVLTGHRATIDALARAGWITTVADLWPTTTSELGLILAWPAATSTGASGPAFALFLAAALALVAVVVFMRFLMRPLRELETSRAQLETLYREARKDSLRDGLTGMGNHRAFQEELARQVELAERDGAPFSLLLLDLDNLKIVNDREGHAEGDQLLLGLAAAMREALRETDRFFRIGGDEFAVLMPDTEPQDAMEAAGRLRHYCLRPPAGERAISFSGGVSAVPRFALEAGRVQRQADAALYWAKRHGRGFVELFDPERDTLANEPGPEGIGNAVYEIARSRALTPVFQPIVDLRTGAVLGFEGLVRPAPDAPFANSDALFAAAAATGRAVELDLACLETVAAGATAIGRDHIISLNLSAKTLEVKDFDSGWLLNTLVRHGISPSRVVVELTERDPITDVKRLQNNVRHLAEYGLRLAADDVGAGSAGLRMLAEVPFDIVKIDLSLVQDGAQQAASWAVLRSIRDLAWRQEAVIIGEGVETPEQLRALRQLAIPIGQGYLLGRPEAKPDVRPRDLTSLTIVGGPASRAGGPPADHPGVAPAPYVRELPVEHPGRRPLPPPPGPVPLVPA